MRTETTDDQDWGLKATVHVCTACIVVSLSTTDQNFVTPPLTKIAPFDARFASIIAEEFKQFTVPTQNGLKKKVLSLSSSRISGLKKFSPAPNLASINVQNFALHFAIALHLPLALLLAIAVAVVIRSS